MIERTAEDLEQLKKLKLLISGSFRGGTTYASHVLRELGWHMGHESIFPRASFMAHKLHKSRKYDGDASGSIYQYTSLILEAGIPVIQLVRHPVSVINSHLGHGVFLHDEKWSNAHWYCAHHITMTVLDPVDVVHLEAFEEEFPVAMARAGYVFTEEQYKKAFGAYRGKSTPTTKRTWYDIPERNRQLALQLGYDEHGYTGRYVATSG